MSTDRRVGTLNGKGAVLLLALVLVAAACGGSGESTTTAAATTTAAPAETSTTAAAETTTTAEALGEYAALCPPGEAPDQMVIGVWAGTQSDEIVLPGLAEFMEQTGVEVTTTGDGTGDRLAKIRGGAGLDAALLPVNEVTSLLEEGYILPTDESLPNFGNLIDAARIPGGYGTSLLVDVIAFNPEFVSEPPTSWLDILKPEYAGHVAIGNIPGANGYAGVAMVNRALGGSDDDLTLGLEAFAEAAANDQFLTLIDFGPSMEPLVESGDLWIYPEIAGVLQNFIQGGGPLEMVVPQEGAAAMMNTAVIPVDAQHEGCSKALVGALLTEPVQSRYIQHYFYHPTVDNIQIPADVRDLVLPREGEDLVTIDWAAIDARADEYIDFFNQNVAGG